MVGLATAMGIGRFGYTPLLPAMMAGLRLSASQAGWIAAANFVGYLLGAILAAGGWGQGKERGVVLGALLLSSLLAASMAVAGDVFFMILIRFLAGMASAFCLVFLLTLVLGQLSEANRDDLQPWLFSGVGLGIALSSILTGAIYLEHADWRWGWIGFAVLSLAGTTAVFMLLRSAPVALARPQPEPALPRDRSFWAITLSYGLFGAGYVVTATFLVAIVRGNGSGPLMEAAVWLVTGVSAFVSLFVWRLAAHRLGLLTIYALACLVEAAGVVASVTIPGSTGPLLGGFLLGATFMVLTGYGQAAGRLWAAQSPRKALAAMTACLGVGQVLGPIAAGYLVDWTGSFLVPSLGAAALLLLSGIVALWAGWTARWFSARSVKTL